MPSQTIPTTIHHPGSPSSNETYHLIFITGNPGLIAYYIDFLAALHTTLNSSPLLQHANASVAVYGRSLTGFEIGTHDKDDTEARRQPLSLHDQILSVERSVAGYIESLPTSNRPPKVILIGHSVGAYILLTLLDRHLASQAASPNLRREEKELGANIVGGICLFPTVVDIAASASGRKLKWLLSVPDWVAGLFGRSVGSFARGLAWMLGSRFEAVIRKVTGMGPKAATVTAGFLASARGVRQGLHMGRDELLNITSDRWDARIWGSATSALPHSPQQQPAKLFFYFGRTDHWVADHTRDELIASRAYRGVEAGEEWRPTMEIDEMGTPHGFCIHDSEPIALKCRDYVEQIIKADLNSGRDY